MDSRVHAVIILTFIPLLWPRVYCGRRCFFKFIRFVVWYAHRLAHEHFVLLFYKRQRYDATMAAECSSSKMVSFAGELTSKP